MTINSSYIKPYPNVIPVRGFNRSILADLTLNRYQFIPNYLCDFLLKNPSWKFKQADFLRLGNSEEDFEEIMGLLSYLINEDYLTEADESLFSGLSTELPVRSEDSFINDCIIELSVKSDWNLKTFFRKINPLGARFLEIRFLDFVSFENHQKIIEEELEDHCIERVNMLIPFDDKLQKILETGLMNFTRLNEVIIYNTSKSFSTTHLPFAVQFSKQPGVENSYCGCIHPTHFTNSVTIYFSNLNSNSCLSYKLSITEDGFIKNCPSKKDNYGNLEVANLTDLSTSIEFQKDWDITKEKVLICSDCEFRWMCSDCRVFIQDTDNPFSKPAKCTYNPYISKWEWEEGYLPEHETGISIVNNKVVVDTEKLNQINTSLWA